MSAPYRYGPHQGFGDPADEVGYTIPKPREVSFEAALAARERAAQRAEDASREWEGYQPWTETRCTRHDCHSSQWLMREHIHITRRCACGAPLFVEHTYRLQEGP